MPEGFYFFVYGLNPLFFGKIFLDFHFTYHHYINYKMTNNTPEKFHKALKEENLDNIDECIQNGLRINQQHSYTVYTSSRYGVVDNTYTFTPLMEAVENQSIKVVGHLLKRGADVLKKYPYLESPLSIATRKGNLEMVKLLLKNGAKPTMQTAFLVAIETRKLDIVRYMVENGACINWKYTNGETPLSKSITTNNCEEIAKFLIDSGANVEELDINNKTPLALSVEYERFDTLKYLLKRDADINKVDNSGRTALSVAASKSNFSAAKYLIEFGADVSLAQTEIEKYAKRDEDFDIFLKLSKIEQLRLGNSNKEAVSVPKSNCKCLHCNSLLNLPRRQLECGQEEAPSASSK